MEWITLFIEFVVEYLSEHVYILIPVLFFAGYLLKQTPKVEDWLIPYILLVLGILFAIGILGVNVAAVLQGILVVSVAVFAHQMIKQADNKFNFRQFISGK